MDKTISQFKVGDEVKVLPRKGSETNYSPWYIDDMQRYAERFAIIIGATESSCKINLDGGLYHWPFEALQLVPYCTKEEIQTKTELNLFPTKKHYQLNFNY